MLRIQSYQFALLFGCVANVGKSSMFVAIMCLEDASPLAHFMGFELGFLSVHYLGLPLLTRLPKVSYYLSLTQKVTN